MREEWKVETRKREEGKEGKKRETTDPKLTIFSQRQLPLMVNRSKIIDDKQLNPSVPPEWRWALYNEGE